jgi:hypothetical protein
MIFFDFMINVRGPGVYEKYNWMSNRQIHAS